MQEPELSSCNSEENLNFPSVILQQAYTSLALHSLTATYKNLYAPCTHLQKTYSFLVQSGPYQEKQSRETQTLKTYRKHKKTCQKRVKA